MKTNFVFSYATILLCLLFTVPTQSQETLKGARTIAIEQVQTPVSPIQRMENDHATFSVLVNVDRSTRQYREDDLLTASVKTSRDGFLYLVHISSTGKEMMIIPNAFQKDNAIKAGEEIAFPAKSANFRFRVAAPFGRETIKAFVTTRKLESIDDSKFTKADATVLSDFDSTAMVRELTQSKNAKALVLEGTSMEFASHDVSYTTHAKSASSPPTPTRTNRYFVGFSVGKYQDPIIPRLHATDADANAMGKLAVEYLGVTKDNCDVYTNEQVTLENVAKIFNTNLPNVTKPGDIIFIYWSGHGGQMARTHDTPSSRNCTTYLVPFDGSTKDPENTMLLENPFGHWVQKLNGRKIVFIIDACHSGNMAERPKSLDNPEDVKDIEFTFGFENFARSKALGQKDLAILCSSAGDQRSFERIEGDLSVMTYCLIEAIKTGSRGMTHKDIKPRVREGVDRYIKANLHSIRQTVVEQDDLSPGVVLKP